MIETLILLTAIPLLAEGDVRASGSVHNRLDSMAARIGGLTKKVSSTGFRAVKMNPKIALAQKIAVASRMGPEASRTRIGQVAFQNSVQLLDRARPA
jgi:hypothetical protein